MNFIEKFIKKIGNKDLNKLLPNITLVLLIGIFVVIASNYFLGKNNDNSSYINSINNNISKENNYIEDYSTLVERRLENILNQIKGVGNVKVMISVEETVEKIPAKNTITSKEKTTELDSEGGTREIIREDSNEQIITNGNNSLAVIKQVNPSIKGVIVVAQGVEDITIKEQLYNAVKTVLGISGNRVEVYCSK